MLDHYTSDARRKPMNFGSLVERLCKELRKQGLRYLPNFNKSRLFPLQKHPNCCYSKLSKCRVFPHVCRNTEFGSLPQTWDSWDIGVKPAEEWRQYEKKDRVTRFNTTTLRHTNAEKCMLADAY